MLSMFEIQAHCRLRGWGACWLNVFTFSDGVGGGMGERVQGTHTMTPLLVLPRLFPSPQGVTMRKQMCADTERVCAPLATPSHRRRRRLLALVRLWGRCRVGQYAPHDVFPVLAEGALGPLAEEPPDAARGIFLPAARRPRSHAQRRSDRLGKEGGGKGKQNGRMRYAGKRWRE